MKTKTKTERPVSLHWYRHTGQAWGVTYTRERLAGKMESCFLVSVSHRTIYLSVRR